MDSQGIGIEEKSFESAYGFHIEAESLEEDISTDDCGLVDLERSQQCKGCGCIFTCIDVNNQNKCHFCGTRIDFLTVKDMQDVEF